MPRIDTIVVHAGPQGPTGATGTNIYVQPGDPGSVADGTLWLDTDDTTPDTSLNWGDIAGTLSNQTDLNTALAAKAPLASPALTGTPTAPTAAPGTNTTQVATTAFVAANSSTSPLTTKGDLYGYSTTNTRVPVGTDGQVLTADSTQAAGVKWGIAAGVQYQWKSGTWHNSADAVRATATGTSAQGAASIAWVPVLVTEACTVNAIALNVTTAVASSTARVGLFTYNGIGTMTLLLDSGSTIDTSTTGLKTVTISQALNPACYWVGCITSAAISLTSTSGATYGGVGFVNAMDISAGITAFYKSGGETTASFSASYPTITTFTGNAAIFALRKA